MDGKLYADSSHILGSKVGEQLEASRAVGSNKTEVLMEKAYDVTSCKSTSKGDPTLLPNG